MPSSSSSRTGSRKNRGRRRPAPLLLAAAAAAMALGATPRLSAQSLDLAVSARAGVIRASLSLQWNRQAELVSSLRDGLESRIVFTLRVYQKRGGILPLFRDRLLSETVIARSAFWDFLDGKFIVESDDGGRTSYASADDLLAGFLTVKNLAVYRGPLSGSRERYVSARARIEPVRLMPPLTIVSLVGTAAAYTTPWQRRQAQ